MKTVPESTSETIALFFEQMFAGPLWPASIMVCLMVVYTLLAMVGLIDFGFDTPEIDLDPAIGYRDELAWIILSGGTQSMKAAKAAVATRLTNMAGHHDRIHSGTIWARSFAMRPKRSRSATWRIV
jgi:hypothetical protein